MCLLRDSLYANQNVFEICAANNWSYIIRFKDGSLPAAAQELNALSEYDGSVTTKVEGNVSRIYRYVNEIDHEAHKINMVECGEVTRDPAAETTEMQIFTFITSPDLRISKRINTK